MAREGLDEKAAKSQKTHDKSGVSNDDSGTSSQNVPKPRLKSSLKNKPAEQTHTESASSQSFVPRKKTIQEIIREARTASGKGQSIIVITNPDNGNSQDDIQSSLDDDDLDADFIPTKEDYIQAKDDDEEEYESENEHKVKKGTVVKNPTQKKGNVDSTKTFEEENAEKVTKAPTVKSKGKQSCAKKKPATKVTKKQTSYGTNKKAKQKQPTRSSPRKETSKKKNEDAEKEQQDENGEETDPSGNRRPVWKDDEINGLVHASVTRKQTLRGTFKGPGGSRKRKVNGWKNVASK